MDSEFHKRDRGSHIHVKFEYHGVNAFTFNPDLFKLDTLVIRKRGHRPSVFLISVIRELHFVAFNPQFYFLFSSPESLLKRRLFYSTFLVLERIPYLRSGVSFNSNQWYVIFRSGMPSDTSMRFPFNPWN